jgi:hypothetical protein
MEGNGQATIPLSRQDGSQMEIWIGLKVERKGVLKWWKEGKLSKGMDKHVFK